MRAFGLIVAIEVTVLGLVAFAQIRGEQRVTFPPSIAAPAAQRSLGASASVPVSIVIHGFVGSTRTAFVARGGEAVAVSAGP